MRASAAMVAVFAILALAWTCSTMAGPPPIVILTPDTASPNYPQAPVIVPPLPVCERGQDPRRVACIERRVLEEKMRQRIRAVACGTTATCTKG